jgi:ankyrin repeat protein
VTALLEAGADVEAQMPRGSRPLHVAAQHGHVEAVRTLAEGGADVEAQADDAARPLHCAALSGCAATMGALLEPGVDIHAVDAYGRTPLHYASSSRQCSRCWRQGLTSTAATSVVQRLCVRLPATARLRR